MKNTRRAIAVIAGTAIALTCSFVLLCAAQSFLARIEGKRLLSALNEVKVGVTTEETARDIFRSFRADDTVMGGRIFDFHVTGPGYSVTNRGLALLRATPKSQLSVSLFFYKGLLVVKNAGFERGEDRTCCAVSVSEATAEFSTFPPETMPGGLRIEERGDRIAGLILVHLDSRVPEDVRKAAFNFNLACLTNLGGCTDANDLLPNIRKASDELHSTSN